MTEEAKALLRLEYGKRIYEISRNIETLEHFLEVSKRELQLAQELFKASHKLQSLTEIL